MIRIGKIGKLTSKMPNKSAPTPPPVYAFKQDFDNWIHLGNITERDPHMVLSTTRIPINGAILLTDWKMVNPAPFIIRISQELTEEKLNCVVSFFYDETQNPRIVTQELKWGDNICDWKDYLTEHVLQIQIQTQTQTNNGIPYRIEEIISEGEAPFVPGKTFKQDFSKWSKTASKPPLPLIYPHSVQGEMSHLEGNIMRCSVENYNNVPWLLYNGMDNMLNITYTIGDSSPMDYINVPARSFYTVDLTHINFKPGSSIIFSLYSPGNTSIYNFYEWPTD